MSKGAAAKDMVMGRGAISNVKGVHEAGWKNEHGGDEVQIIKGSVHNQQTRLRNKYGVTALHVTHGLDEQVRFQEEQDRINKSGRPFFIMCDSDMAGSCDLTRQKAELWRLWKMYGEGHDVFSELNIVRRPVGGRVEQQLRLEGLAEEGIIVVPDIPKRDDTVPPWEFNLRRYQTNVAMP